MTDLSSYPLPVLLILLGLFALFLSIGGTIAGSVAPKGKEKLVGGVGVILIISGISIVILQSRRDPNELAPTEVVVVQVEQTKPPEIMPTSTPTSTPTATPIINTPTSTQTATAVPLTNTPTNTPTTAVIEEIDTPVPTPIPTNTAVPSNTPIPPTPTIETVLYLVDTGQGGVNIYTRDSDIEGLPRGMVDDGDIVETIETNEDESWHLITIGGIEGWIRSNYLIPFDGEVPPTPEANGTPLPTRVSQCVQENVSFRENPGKEFDDVILSWSNVPAGADRLRLSVTGIIDGNVHYVVHPSNSEVTATYTIGRWMFENGGFSGNSTFTYTVDALDGSDIVICTTVGTFDQ